jgi:hypothetical protein
VFVHQENCGAQAAVAGDALLFGTNRRAKPTPRISIAICNPRLAYELRSAISAKKGRRAVFLSALRILQVFQRRMVALLQGRFLARFLRGLPVSREIFARTEAKIRKILPHFFRCQHGLNWSLNRRNDPSPNALNL